MVIDETNNRSGNIINFSLHLLIEKNKVVTDKISDNIILSFDNTSGRKNKENGNR